MKKSFKTILSASIASAIFISSVIGSFAAEDNSEPPKSYVVTCIGDSSPNGNCLGKSANSPNCSPRLGLQYTHDPQYTMEDGTILMLGGACNGDRRSGYTYYLPEDVASEEYEEGALKEYPVLVAEALNNIENGSITDFQSFYDKVEFYPMSASMVRSCDVLYALDNSYSLDDLLWQILTTELKREDIKEIVDNGAIENSNIVILAFGGNDIFAGPIYKITSDTSTGIKKIKNAINALNTGVETFNENFPRIMEELQNRNSECTYVIVGVYNPLYQYTINDILKLFGIDIGIFGKFLKAGNLLDSMINKINTEMQKIANDYENVIYVDSYGVPILLDEIVAGNDVEIPIAANENISVQGINSSAVSSSPVANGIHPTEAGHEWLARKVLAAVEQIKVGNDKLIALDVYGMDEIEKILCDGKSVEYTLSDDGNTAFIEGNGNQTLKVKIVGKNDEAKTSREWKCTKSNNGYWTRILSDKT